MVKIYTKIDIKLFSSNFSLISLIYSKYFLRDCMQFGRSSLRIVYQAAHLYCENLSWFTLWITFECIARYSSTSLLIIPRFNCIFGRCVILMYVWNSATFYSVLIIIVNIYFILDEYFKPPWKCISWISPWSFGKMGKGFRSKRGYFFNQI